MHCLHARLVALTSRTKLKPNSIPRYCGAAILTETKVKSNLLLLAKMKSKDQHQQACFGMSIVTVVSPIGDIEIHSCQSGLHMVKQIEADDKNFSPDESRIVKVKLSNSKNIPAFAEESVRWLKDYFSHGIAKQEIPELCPTIIKEGSFRSQAWCSLPNVVPFGKTITYKQLASLCGSPRACQAAGTAMSSNPISFLIPCHRVLPSTGGVGNYSLGKKNSIKAWLLDFEQRGGSD